MIDTKYIAFWFGTGFEFSYAVCGYFDNRPQIHISLFFFHLILKLPFKNKWTDECDPPKWGISFHGDILFIYRGGKGNGNGGNKWWSMYAPWSWQWVRTSSLRKDGTWEHESKGNRKDFWSDKWNDVLWSATHPYTYVLKSGEVQERTATIKVEQREWRWHWLKWLNFPKRIQTTIDVRFNDEVGERTGSWKGGTTGCGYELKNGETPFNCLKRMERERKFN